MLPPDPNPLMDSGAPESIGGTQSAALLCDCLGIQLVLEPPEQHFLHGWGPQMLDAKSVRCSWKLPVEGVDGRTTYFLFHLVHGDEPLVIGEAVTSRAKIDNIENLLHLRQGDGSYATSQPYYTTRDGHRRLSVVPPPLEAEAKVPAQLSSYLATSAKHLSKIGHGRLAKKLHGYSHATVLEMKRICKMAGILTFSLQEALEIEH